MGSIHKGHPVASSQALSRGSKRKALLLVGTACLLLVAFKSAESGRSLRSFTGADVHLLEGKHVAAMREPGNEDHHVQGPSPNDLLAPGVYENGHMAILHTA